MKHVIRNPLIWFHNFILFKIIDCCKRYDVVRDQYTSIIFSCLIKISHYGFYHSLITHTHTHTHRQTERERERERDYK